jgi:hypothetical protein
MSVGAVGSPTLTPGPSPAQAGEGGRKGDHLLSPPANDGTSNAEKP